MVCENVNVGVKAKMKLNKWDEEIFSAERNKKKKNYNNVQVIFIRVETEKKRRKKNIKKIKREWKKFSRDERLLVVWRRWQRQDRG